MKLVDSGIHNRTLIVTGLPYDTPDRTEEKFPITIGYVSPSSAYKGGVLDGVVIPRIIKTFNNHDALVAKLKEVQKELASGTVSEEMAKHLSVEIGQLLTKIS